MPLFAFIGHDVPNSTENRKIHRSAHLARIQDLNAQNRLVIAGPNPTAHGDETMTGSLLILDFDDLAQAQAWANDEPYLIGGVYSHIDIKPFVQVLPTKF